MKNYFVSTLTAIALALPLGIVGMVGGTSTAQAVDAAYHFSTCSDDVIWKCHGDVQTAILFDGGYTRIFSSAAALPRGSNGKDQGAFGALRWRVSTNFNGTGHDSLRYLRQFFSDDDVKEFNEEYPTERFQYKSDGFNCNHEVRRGCGAHDNTGFISPDERARFESHSTLVIRNDVLNSEDPARITEYYCNQVEGEYRDSGRSIRGPSCIRDGGITDSLEYVKYFEEYNYRIGRLLPHHLEPLREREERERIARVARELENRNNALVARYEANCRRHNGRWDEDGGSLGRGSCLAFQHYDSAGAGVYRYDEFAGYDPDDPYGYVRRLNDVIVPDEASDRFVRTCSQESGTIISFPEHGVLNCSVPTSETFNGQTFIGSDLYSFRPGDSDLGFDNPDITLASAQPPARQVTVIDELTLAGIEDIADHQDATVATRGALVDLQRDHNFVEDRLEGLIDANTVSIGEVNVRVDSLTDDVEANTTAITNLDTRVQANTAAIANLVEETSKNTAGVALSLALNSQPLHYGKNYAVTGGLGNFGGETGIGFSFTGRLTDNLFGNLGAGFAGSGDSSAQGVKGSLSFQW